MPGSIFRPGISPWQALQQLREQMDGILGQAFGPGNGEWAPPIDLDERENEFVLTAELPGLTPENIDLEIDGDVLTLRGEKKEDREEKEGERYYYERRYGSFLRRIALPQAVDPDQVRAHYENGILRVTMPKRDVSRGKRVEIESGG